MARTSWFGVAPAGAALALLLAGCGAGASSTAVGLVGADTGRATGASSTAAARPAAASPARPAARASAASSPRVVVRTERVTKPIRFKTVTRRDPDLDKGDRRVVRAGVAGVLELTFRVTYTDGVPTARALASKRTLQAPVTEVVAVGTRVAVPAGGSCDPNYTGACVPIDTDVDCAGGSGNGPSYVQGPVRVVGDDIYGLDRDGDGIGCD